MEDSIIISRAILGMVCVINIFIGYASTRGFVKRAISKKSWITVFVVEVVLITAYILYDNIFVSSHPQNGWLVAILGYAFVYLMAFLVWFSFYNNTRLEKDKVYLMKRVVMISFTDQEFVEGEIEEGGKKIRVLLDNTLTKAEVPAVCEVKFDSVEDHCIIVRPAKED